MPAYPVQELAEDIARCIAPDEFDHAARHALRAFDDLNAEIIAQKSVKLACREGCSLCCSLRVDAFAHEVFLLARHVRSNFTAEQIADLFVRLAEHSSKVLPLTPFEHATTNIRCPLLQDGRCTAYPARPHSCRRHHSQDFSTCQFTFDHPKDLESPAAHDRELFGALTAGMQENIDAYSTVGFDHTIYELGTALHEALTDPSSWQRWRDREQAFLRASVTPAG